MTTPEPCTNWHETKRHLSTDLAPYRYGGRSGKPLCVNVSKTDVYDADAMSGLHDAFSYGTRKPKPFDAIPECKLCTKKAAKLAQEGQ